MNLRRTFALAAVSLCFATVIVLPMDHDVGTAAAAGANPYVTIVADSTARTIRISARLVLLSAPGEDEQFMRDLAREMKTQIEAIWSGTNYKCWKVVTTVDIGIRMVDQTSSSPDDPDVLEIQIVSSPNRALPGRSFVVVSGDDDARSDSPADLYPALPQGSVFSVNSRWRARAWAHEFGHILGLGDSYEQLSDGSEVVKDGLANDVMAFNTAGPPAASSITKLLRRNGVDLSMVKCPMSMDTEIGTVWALGFGTGTFKLHAFTCDYAPDSSDPKSFPKITFQGLMRVKGSVSQSEADAATSAVDFVIAAAAIVGGSSPPAPTFNAGTGAVEYQFSFTTSGDPYEDVAITAGSLVLTYRFAWRQDGLLYDAKWGAMLNGAPGDAFAPIVSLRMPATFTQGATECP